MVLVQYQADAIVPSYFVFGYLYLKVLVAELFLDLGTSNWEPIGAPLVADGSGMADGIGRLDEPGRVGSCGIVVISCTSVVEEPGCDVLRIR